MQGWGQQQKKTRRETTLILAAIGLLCGIRNAQAQTGAPSADRAALVKQLITRTVENYRANLTLAKAKPEETFEIVRDNWKNLTGVTSKQSLLDIMVHSDNPHVLEILDLGATDNDVLVQDKAFELLQGFAYRNFSADPDAYPAWHKGIVGKPVEEVVASGCTAFVAQYLEATGTALVPVYNLLMGLEFNDKGGLAQVRRRAALDAGILTGVEKALARQPASDADTDAIQRHLQVMQHVQPGEEVVKQIVLPLTTRNTPPEMRHEAAFFLGSLKVPWASDRLFDMLLDNPSEIDMIMYRAAIVKSGDQRFIPKLIALMEADDSQQIATKIDMTLQRLTKNRMTDPHDGGWWHIWWDRNKANFPEDVQAVPFPKLMVRKSHEADGFYLRRHAELHQLGEDPQRAYWLLCPAYDAPTTVQAGSPSPPKPAFGLIVALADGAGNGEDLTDFWQDAILKSLKDGYFVALPVAPKWNAHQPSAWVTQQNMAQVKEARFSTETFLQKIVKDVQEHYPINPSRLFLHGVGEGGLAAYACSLSETTPFKGFYILSSPFKAAQLPPLMRAKGRRYLIQASKEDKVAPFFQATAAEELLRKQSAVVKLVTTQGEHGYKFAESPWEQLAQAIGWLEAPY